MLLYVVSIAFWLKHRDQAARIAWTGGCLCFLAHVVAAFGFRHHWSHAAAYVETARQTRDVFGIDWGGGIYFNYAFAILWIADTIWWWLSGIEGYRNRPRAAAIAIQVFFAFMFFNGAIVFGSPFSRWLGTASILVLLVLAASRSRLGQARSPLIRTR